MSKSDTPMSDAFAYRACDFAPIKKPYLYVRYIDARLIEKELNKAMARIKELEDELKKIKE